MNIAEYIPYGKENAISRQQLTIITGIKDRKVRKLIEEARVGGELILNLQDGKGYFRATENDLDSLEHQYKLNRSRAMSVLVQQKFLRRILKEAGREIS